MTAGGLSLYTVLGPKVCNILLSGNYSEDIVMTLEWLLVILLIYRYRALAFLCRLRIVTPLPEQ